MIAGTSSETASSTPQPDILIGVDTADAPPALSKLADQVAALNSKGSGTVTSATATVTPEYTTSSKPAPLKSGFFNKQSAKSVNKTSQQSKVGQC